MNPLSADSSSSVPSSAPIAPPPAPATSAPIPAPVAPPPPPAAPFHRTVTHMEEQRGIVNWIVEIFRRLFTGVKKQRAKDLHEDAKDLVGQISRGDVISHTSEGVLKISSAVLNPAGFDASSIPDKKKLRPLLRGAAAEQTTVPEIRVGRHVLQPHACEGTGATVSGGNVVGTASSSPHLANLYLTSFDEIRCGAINSPQKAQELMDAIRLMRPEGKVRIVVNQLNSFEKAEEAKLVRSEHRVLAAAKGEGIQIAHLNTPTNRNYEWTLTLKKYLPEALVERFFKGERKSHAQNLESLALMVGWLNEDVKGDPSFMNYANLKELQEKSQGLLCDLNDPSKKDQRVALRQELHDTRQKIKKELIMQHNLLKEAREKNLIPQDKRQECLLMEKLLASQLGIQPMSRAQEIMVIMLLNREMGVLSVVNCKSGLDRTGNWSAAHLALIQMLEDPLVDKNAVINMVLNWEQVSRDSIFVEKFRVDLSQMLSDSTVGKKAMINRILNSEQISRDPALAEKLRMMGEDPLIDKNAVIDMVLNSKQIFRNYALVKKFRMHCLENMIQVGLPITFYSTGGMLGLKWGKGFTGQLTPLHFIPEKIVIDEKEVTLVKYDSSGSPASLTEEGHRLLTRFSALRGA